MNEALAPVPRGGGDTLGKHDLGVALGVLAGAVRVAAVGAGVRVAGWAGLGAPLVVHQPTRGSPLGADFGWGLKKVCSLSHIF